MFVLNPVSQQPDLYKSIYPGNFLPRLSLSSPTPFHQLLAISDYSFSIFNLPPIQKISQIPLDPSLHVAEALVLPSDPENSDSKDIIFLFFHTSSDIHVYDLDQETLEFKVSVLEDQSPLATNYDVLEPNQLRFDRFTCKNTLLTFTNLGLMQIHSINYKALPKNTDPAKKERLFSLLLSVNLAFKLKDEELLINDIAFVGSPNKLGSWIVVTKDGDVEKDTEIELKTDRINADKIYFLTGDKIHIENKMAYSNAKIGSNNQIVFVERNEFGFAKHEMKCKEEFQKIEIAKLFKEKIPCRVFNALFDKNFLETADIYDKSGLKLFGVGLNEEGICLVENDLNELKREEKTRENEIYRFTRVSQVWSLPNGKTFGFISGSGGRLQLSKLEDYLPSSVILEIPKSLKSPMCFNVGRSFFLFDDNIGDHFFKIDFLKPKPYHEKAKNIRMQCLRFPSILRQVLGVVKKPGKENPEIWVLSTDTTEGQIFLQASLCHEGVCLSQEKSLLENQAVQVFTNESSFAAAFSDYTVGFYTLMHGKLEKITEMKHHKILGPADLLEMKDGSLIFVYWVYNGQKSTLRVARVSKDKGKEVNQIDMGSVWPKPPVLVSLKVFPPLESEGSLWIYASLADGRVTVIKIKEEGLDKIESISVVSGCSAVLRAFFPCRDIGVVQDGLEIKVVFGETVSSLVSFTEEARLLRAYNPPKTKALFVLVQLIKSNKTKLIFVENYENSQKTWAMHTDISYNETPKPPNSEPKILVSSDKTNAIVHWKGSGVIKRLQWDSMKMKCSLVDVASLDVPDHHLELVVYLPNELIVFQRRIVGYIELVSIADSKGSSHKIYPPLRIENGSSADALGSPNRPRSKFISILTLSSFENIWVVVYQNELKLFDIQLQEVCARPQPTRDKVIFAKSKDKIVLVGLQKFSVVLYEIAQGGALQISPRFSEFEARSIFSGGFLENSPLIYWGNSCFGDFFLTSFGKESQAAAVAKNLKNVAVSRIFDLVIDVVKDTGSKNTWNAIGHHGGIYSFKEVSPPEGLVPLISKALLSLTNSGKKTSLFIDKNILRSASQNKTLEKAMRDLDVDRETYFALESFLMQNTLGPSLKNLK